MASSVRRWATGVGLAGSAAAAAAMIGMGTAHADTPADYNQESLVTNLESQQTDLPAADQAGLADVDEKVLQADQQVLDAAQAFVSADQAGDLATSTGALTANLDLVEPGLATLGPLYDAIGADFGALFFSALGIPDFLLP